MGGARKPATYRHHHRPTEPLQQPARSKVRLHASASDPPSSPQIRRHGPNAHSLIRGCYRARAPFFAAEAEWRAVAAAATTRACMLCVATYNPILQHISRVLQRASVFRCSDRHEPCGLATVAEILQSSTRLCALRLCGNGIGGSDEGETHGSSLPQPRRDWAYRCHICAGTGPHQRRDWAHSGEICTSVTGRTPATPAHCASAGIEKLTEGIFG
jgi:hypothetical protein